MDKDKLNEIETEIDGIEFALQDVMLGVRVSLKRLNDLRELLQDKKEEF